MSIPSGWPAEPPNLVTLGQFAQAVSDGVALVRRSGRPKVVAWNRALNARTGGPQTQAGQAFASQILKAIADRDSNAADTPLPEWPGFSVCLLDLPNDEPGSDWQVAIVRFDETGETAPSTLDALTGVADRRALETWVARRASLPGDRVRPFAVVFVDFDDFKHINDTHGHTAGDAALVDLARRLNSRIRAGDLLVRYGGDEFVIIADGIDRQADLHPLIRRLSSVVDTPVDVQGAATSLGISIGAACSAEGFTDFESVLAAADRRMYVQKRSATK